jgi:F-type H+-transporting ATPase subunit b
MKSVFSLLMMASLSPVAVAAESSGGFIGGLMYSLNDPVTHTAFLAMIVFLLIAGRMGAFKAILGGLDSRAALIRKELEEAASLREQAAEALALAERRQQDAEKEAEAIVEQAKLEAKAMLEEAKRELAEKIARREAQAAARIARAEADATNDVRRAAADAATQAARRLLAEQSSVDQFEAAAREIEAALS